jgi:alginate O-acetyltransferase complex protein AlgI
MAVSGLWHGAQWHFLVWGLYHGVLLAGFRVWERLVKAPLLARAPWLVTGSAGRVAHWVASLLGGAITFTLVTIGWGLFVMPVDRFVLMLGRLL